jgi:hypothetical protein
MNDLYETDNRALGSRSAPPCGRQRHRYRLAEEIEAMGRSDKREIRNRLVVLCAYLLKWRFQPTGRGGSWRCSIVEARDCIADLIEESPSLAHLAWAYSRGRGATADTGLLDLPPECPWAVVSRFGVLIGGLLARYSPRALSCYRP